MAGPCAPAAPGDMAVDSARCAAPDRFPSAMRRLSDIQTLPGPKAFIYTRISNHISRVSLQTAPSWPSWARGRRLHAPRALPSAPLGDTRVSRQPSPETTAMRQAPHSHVAPQPPTGPVRGPARPHARPTPSHRPARVAPFFSLRPASQTGLSTAKPLPAPLLGSVEDRARTWRGRFRTLRDRESG